MRIGTTIKEWEIEGGVRLFDVPDLSVDDRAEREEQEEHLTTAA